MLQKFLMGLLWLSVAALSNAPAAEPPPVGLLNIDRVFKEFKPFREKQTELLEAAREVEQKVQTRQAELETVNSQLRKTAQGTPDFTRLQIQAFKLHNELQQFINTERANIQKLEATLLLTAHRRLDAIVSKYAKAKGIKLVLRYHEISFEESQPVPDIAKTVNRQVLYEDGLDITDAILKELEAEPAPGGSR